MTEIVQPIPARLKNVAVGGHVAGASDIIDDSLNKTQNVINSEVASEISTIEEIVGSGGSIDTRISTAVNTAKSQIRGTATTACDTLGEAEALISEEATRAQTAEADRYTKSETYTKAEVDNIASAFTSQKYETYEATAQTTAATDVLPVTGATDTLYRISKWDGSAYNANTYSEYTWNGSSYIQMDVKNPGIDTEPTPGSHKLVESGGVDKRLEPLDFVYDNNLTTTDNIFTFENLVPGVVKNDGTIGTLSGTYTTDYIPVSANTTYYGEYWVTQSNAMTMISVGFYNNGTYIDRVNNVTAFTTPANCTHVRISSQYLFSNGNRRKVSVSTKGMINYQPNKKITDVKLEIDDDVKYLKYFAYGLNSCIEEAEVHDMFINNSNVWASNTGTREFLLPVKENQTVYLSNPKSTTAVYAFLKDDTIKSSQAPSFVYQYDYIVDELDGSVTWTIKEDEHGNPILDTRRLLNGKTNIQEIVPPETKFLYVSAISVISGKQYNILPSVIIDDLDYTKVETMNSESEYDTVFYDDFSNGLDTNIWIRHTQSKTSGGRYNSRFKSSEDNVYVDNGILVLACNKDATSADGTYDKDGVEVPVQYTAPYISTGDSLALKSGKISVRLKCTEKIADGMFPFAFWTFGQNNTWPIAHEMDVAEAFISASIEDKTASDGTLIPAGSHLSQFSNGFYVRTANGNLLPRSYYFINWALYNQGVYDRSIDFLNKVDPTQWHTYSIEWDENGAVYSVDGKVFKSYDAISMGAIDADGNPGLHYPEDIRFNIKAPEFSQGQSAYLYIDWVKVETKELNPCTSISHNNISLSVDNGIYIQPTFNEGCTNNAFVADIGNTGVYTGVVNPAAGSGDSPAVIHPNDGSVTPVENTVYLLNNGDMYILDDNLLKKCDKNGNILDGETGDPLTDYILPVDLDNGVIVYKKYLNNSSMMTAHRIVGHHSGATTVELTAANKRTKCTFNVTVTAQS